MKVYDLGEIGWKETQLYYHAMAHLGLEGVIICVPCEPYFCVGFHQDVSQELDLDHLRSCNIPFFRRETGGGTVRLDSDQVFYQVIVKRDDPAAPANVESFTKKYLKPVMEALGSMDIVSVFRPPNDLLVKFKKISGNGGGDIGDCRVLVGDLLIDFDIQKMCDGLKVPYDNFRWRIESTMRRNITTIKAIKYLVRTDDVVKALVDAYSSTCDEGVARRVPPEVVAKAKELETRMLADEWLFFKRPPRRARRVKLREGEHLIALEVKDPEDGQVKGWLELYASETESPYPDSHNVSYDFLRLQLEDFESDLRTNMLKALKETGIDKKRVFEIVNEVDDRSREWV